MELFGMEIAQVYMYGLLIAGALTLLYVLFADIAEAGDGIPFLNPAVLLAFSTLFFAIAFQQKLADVIMNELPKLPGNFHYVACTVAPLNIPSLKDKFTQDMYIVALTQKYGSKERYVCVKDLEKPTLAYTESAAAKLDDFQRQHELLAAGYVGVNFQMKDGFHEIQFVKPTLS